MSAFTSFDICTRIMQALSSTLTTHCSEFSQDWYKWLVSTGVFLALTISCKMNGLFTFMTVGTAVGVDLWNLLDYRRGLSMVKRILLLLPETDPQWQKHIGRHFMARVYGLILVPAVVYLFWFYVHFAILTKSGTGDDFMSPAFQETLRDSPLMLNSQGLSFLRFESLIWLTP